LGDLVADLLEPGADGRPGALLLLRDSDVDHERRPVKKPSPSMGEGWEGVTSMPRSRTAITPPLPLPIKGRGKEALAPMVSIKTPPAVRSRRGFRRPTAAPTRAAWGDAGSGCRAW